MEEENVKGVGREEDGWRGICLDGMEGRDGIKG